MSVKQRRGNTIGWDELTPMGQQGVLRARERRRQQAWAIADTSKARLYFMDSVSHYEDQSLAYFVYIHLPHGIRCAFRGAGDTRPVEPWQLVDRM